MYVKLSLYSNYFREEDGSLSFSRQEHLAPVESS